MSERHAADGRGRRGSAAAPRTQEPGTQVVRNPMRDISAYLEKAKPRFQGALAGHLTPERLFRVAITAIQRTPLLLECSQESLALALLEAGQLGLEPNGVLGQAYLVPYKNRNTGMREAQFQPGYRGLVTLAYRSGQVQSFRAVPVFEKDDFDYAEGLDPYIRHKPYMGAEDPGKVVFAYAVAALAEGREHRVMSRHQIEARRRQGQAPDSLMWTKFYDTGAMKTVTKQLCKFLPMSVELAPLHAAVAKDDTVEGGDALPLAAIEPDFSHPMSLQQEPQPHRTRTDDVRERIEVQRSGPEQGAPPRTAAHPWEGGDSGTRTGDDEAETEQEAVEVSAFCQLIYSTRPALREGESPANENQRARLRQMAHLILAREVDEEDRDRLTDHARNVALGASQAGRLIAAGVAAAEALRIELPPLEGAASAADSATSAPPAEGNADPLLF